MNLESDGVRWSYLYDSMDSFGKGSQEVCFPVIWWFSQIIDCVIFILIILYYSETP